MACQVSILIYAESTQTREIRECLMDHVIPTFMNEIISTEGFLIYIYIFFRYILKKIHVVLGKYFLFCYNKYDNLFYYL